MAQPLRTHNTTIATGNIVAPLSLSPPLAHISRHDHA
jgi:hypothetical protein